MKVTSNLQPYWTVRVTGIGHRLLLPSIGWFLDSLDIDAGAAVARGYLLPNRMIEQVSTKLHNALTIVQIFPDTIRLNLARLVQKKVPILWNSQFELPEGYMLTQPVRLSPDSALIMGTEQELSELTHWKTQPGKMPVKDTLIFQEVPLETSESLVLISPQKVRARATAAQYTEGNFNIDVKVKNVPVNRELRLIPATVRLRFLVPFDRYEEVTPEHFEITVDFSTIEIGVRKLIPKVTKKPDFVRAVQLTPPYLSYVITEH